MNCPTCKQPVPTIPEQPRNMVSYKVAKTMLKGILDLDKALEEHLACHIALGFLQKKEVTKRRTLLKTAVISEQGIHNAIALKKPLVALFRLNELQPWQTFDLLKQVGIQTYEWTPIKNFQPIQGYTPQGEKPYLRLIIDEQEVSEDFQGKYSANEWLKQQKDFVTPHDWVEFFLLSAYRGMKKLKRKNLKEFLLEEKNGKYPIDNFLPDVKFWTQFPIYRNSAGNVLGLYWYPCRDSRSVGAVDWYPSRPAGYSAPRLLFG